MSEWRNPLNVSFWFGNSFSIPWERIQSSVWEAHVLFTITGLPGVFKSESECRYWIVNISRRWIYLLRHPG